MEWREKSWTSGGGGAVQKRRRRGKEGRWEKREKVEKLTGFHPLAQCLENSRC